MGAHDRNKAVDLIERLFDDPHGFDFFQAVRLLELTGQARAEIGEGAMPHREPVRFAGRYSLSFPPSDISKLTRDPDGRPTMEVSFLGLGGLQGPLPPPFAELVSQRLRARDRAMAAFLDMFGHRLVSLMYRAYKVHRPTMQNGRPEDSVQGRMLMSAIGLGLPATRNRLLIPDGMLLRYVGLLSHRNRSAEGMRRLLSGLFGVPVAVRQLVGRWLGIQDGERTLIGRVGANQHLGQGAVVGTRVWDQQGGVELGIGPLPFQRFEQFLPGGDQFALLGSVGRLYLGTTLDAGLKLGLAAKDVPAARLGDRASARLGWTSWLRSPGPRAEPGVVSLRLLKSHTPLSGTTSSPQMQGA